MQSMLNIGASHGVPLCLSGIIHPLALSHEMEDHDRRRQDMRTQRSLLTEAVHANQEIGSHINYFERDFVEVKGSDQSLSHRGLTVNAA